MTSLDKFAAAWNSCDSLDEVASRANLSPKSIHSYASRARKAGLELKVLPRRHKGYTAKLGHKMHRPGDIKDCPLCEQPTPIEVFYSFPGYTRRSAYCKNCSAIVMRHKTWTALLNEGKGEELLAKLEKHRAMVADMEQVIARYERDEDSVYFVPEVGKKK